MKKQLQTSYCQTLKRPTANKLILLWNIRINSKHHQTNRKSKFFGSLERKIWLKRGAPEHDSTGSSRRFIFQKHNQWFDWVNLTFITFPFGRNSMKLENRMPRIWVDLDIEDTLHPLHQKVLPVWENLKQIYEELHRIGFEIEHAIDITTNPKLKSTASILNNYFRLFPAPILLFFHSNKSIQVLSKLLVVNFQ